LFYPGITKAAEEAAGAGKNAGGIALALGIPPAAVRTRLWKAIRIMRENSQGVDYGKRGGTPD
jgi:hypothetical protein